MKLSRPAIAFTMLLTSTCASASPPPGAPGLTKSHINGLSDLTREEIADDVITYKEYRAAFERFRACIVDSGQSIIGVSFDALTGLVTYAISTGNDTCYNREFYIADEAWQLDADRPKSREEMREIAAIEACIKAELPAC